MYESFTQTVNTGKLPLQTFTCIVGIGWPHGKQIIAGIIYISAFGTHQLFSLCTTYLGCMRCIDTWQITTHSAGNRKFTS